jgi:hypothetical protein
MNIDKNKGEGNNVLAYITYNHCECTNWKKVHLYIKEKSYWQIKRRKTGFMSTGILTIV